MQRASELPGAIFAALINNKIIDRARSTMKELYKIHFQVDASLIAIVKMVEVGDLETIPSFDLCRNQNPMSTKEVFGQGFPIEASRDMELIKIRPTKLVELLMDVNQWSTEFYNIVPRARILGSFSDGVEGILDPQSIVDSVNADVAPINRGGALHGLGWATAHPEKLKNQRL
ncbi:hypothetical protein MTR_2g083320 [Medicago truncatula]|uniref:Uncharacterized protein n=1 Tax=Medicago truncatula TaxID=3880 RepID=G7IJP3_MEDTR|nr:hypothetical protein MTR_2g083320 [Medicago truncatula]